MTANDKVNPYSGKYGFGSNPGWYGYNWNTKQICTLCHDGLGMHTFRMQIYDKFLKQYGHENLVPDYEHLKTLGAIETAVMIGGPSEENTDNPFNVQPAANWDPAGRVFKGMYLPIWKSPGVVNPDNTYAQYLWNMVKTYGQYIKYWEVWNEPDFSYRVETGSGQAEIEWQTRQPLPKELWNLRTEVQWYVRLLRISWEVIKHLSPDSYICTGGIGVPAFLEWILKLTDEPTSGKVTAEFPLTGGAYFDVLSFHTYPEFAPNVKRWTNESDPAKVAQQFPNSGFIPSGGGGGHVYYRHSDACVEGHFILKNLLKDVLVKYGYDGVKYPKKIVICTETGMSRVMDNDNVGGNEIQKNFNVKCHIKTIIEGEIKQTYWYQTADSSHSPAHWDAFGCYYYFGDKQPPNATKADQGIAHKTMSDLLFGKTFDPVKTKALNLPSNVDGGVFTGDKTVIVLWAKTVKDMSETASASVTVPQSVRKDWDFSKTGVSANVSGSVTLNATPSFFEVGSTPTPDPQPTKTFLSKWYKMADGKRLYMKLYKIGTEKYLVETSRDYKWYTSTP